MLASWTEGSCCGPSLAFIHVQTWCLMSCWAHHLKSLIAKHARVILFIN